MTITVLTGASPWLVLSEPQFDGAIDSLGTRGIQASGLHTQDTPHAAHYVGLGMCQGEYISYIKLPLHVSREVWIYIYILYILPLHADM
jgi:hypothetical protein